MIARTGNGFAATQFCAESTIPNPVAVPNPPKFTGDALPGSLNEPGIFPSTIRSLPGILPNEGEFGASN